MTKYDSKTSKRNEKFFTLMGSTDMSKQPWNVVYAPGWSSSSRHRSYYLASSQSLEACSSATASATLSIAVTAKGYINANPKPETPRTNNQITKACACNGQMTVICCVKDFMLTRFYKLHWEISMHFATNVWGSVAMITQLTNLNIDLGHSYATVAESQQSQRLETD